MSQKFWEEKFPSGVKHLHVWQRDRDLPGNRGFEPGETLLAREIGEQLAEARPPHDERPQETLVNQVTQPNDIVIDCMLVEPTDWWIGSHKATTLPRRWPGGVPKIKRPDDAISRAYWKMNEAILWSQIPIKSNDLCVELGSAPGGSSQFLLECGLKVIGIDPAEMDESVIANPPL